MGFLFSRLLSDESIAWLEKVTILIFVLNVGLVFKGICIKALEYSVMLVTGVLVLDVLWQILSHALSRINIVEQCMWSSELSTMLLIWVSLLGASVAFDRKGHMGVDFFVNKLPSKWKIAGEVLVYLIVGFFATAVLIVGGANIVDVTLSTCQRSSSMGVKMGYVYLALPISGIFILIVAIKSGVESLFELFLAGVKSNKGEG
jgi:TRAP-type C4-dicarboxylate transport system permease small subunit